VGKKKEGILPDQRHIQNQEKHDNDKREFLDLIKTFKVDLIVVSADHLEACRFKKMF